MRQPARESESGHQPAEAQRRHGHDGREEEDRQIDFDLPEDSKARRKERPKRANEPEGLKQAERCREPGEEQCFGQELAQQASAAGSERAPERHFRLTLDRLGHEELRGVDACDEEYESRPLRTA